MSQMNHIERVRSEINQYFNSSTEIEESSESTLSPNGKYIVQTRFYEQPQVNRNITKVEIFESENSSLLFSFFVNESTFFHSWVTKNETDYLLCAEDLCGGQTVIDLTNKKMSSFTGDDDGFIWTKHLLSPNGMLLAVFGCGWGSPFFVLIYDFESPMELPLQVAFEPYWVGYDIVEWVDNETLKVLKSENKALLLEIRTGNTTPL